MLFWFNIYKKTNRKSQHLQFPNWTTLVTQSSPLGGSNAPKVGFPRHKNYWSTSWLTHTYLFLKTRLCVFGCWTFSSWTSLETTRSPVHNFYFYFITFDVCSAGIQTPNSPRPLTTCPPCLLINSDIFLTQTAPVRVTRVNQHLITTEGRMTEHQETLVLIGWARSSSGMSWSISNHSVGLAGLFFFLFFPFVSQPQTAIIHQRAVFLRAQEAAMQN